MKLSTLYKRIQDLQRQAADLEINQEKKEKEEKVRKVQALMRKLDVSLLDLQNANL